MDDSTFNTVVPELNKKYFFIFNEIPCISDYSCTREEYVNALKRSIREKSEISNYLNRYQMPDKNVET